MDGSAAQVGMILEDFVDCVPVPVKLRDRAYRNTSSFDDWSTATHALYADDIRMFCLSRQGRSVSAPGQRFISLPDRSLCCDKWVEARRNSQHSNARFKLQCATFKVQGSKGEILEELKVQCTTCEVRRLGEKMAGISRFEDIERRQQRQQS